MADKIPQTRQIHGETLVDDYSWLREKSDPKVVEYLKAENDYAEAMMQPTKEFQKSLYEEMLARIKETDVEVPFNNGYFYYTRTEQGKQYPIFCRKKGTLKAPEEITLDTNKMAKGHRILASAHTTSARMAICSRIRRTRQAFVSTLHMKDLRQDVSARQG